MGGRKITAKSIKRRGAPTHPRSRRAKQLDRVALRDVKLAQRRVVRDRSVSSRVQRIINLTLLLPDDWECLPDLPALHAFMNESYLARHDDELKQLQEARRAGRPPSKHEVELKDLIEAERRDYNENMEIPDLLNATNVALLREWSGDSQSLGLFRLVRISGTNRSQYVRTQDGRHKDFEAEDKAEAAAKSEGAMEVA
ncbi:hypothetical protein BCV69DRAFT_280539 [Microstroma glucosiphilum]|uniref:Translation machinery-associated protein 16 n=1 Tax=Pseudomicrostroma glucosiphilum TaxID=1684307 RepID=A0A316UCH9_9BASI|nr:hypothetical protein BCV69DRAFT_280539 [Pseudomicrostroma glucosiphilum]PWN22930.1 hypothetical protein BCV69DRAFT_280539 [Pseudomicrostroma glucosiphilum]